MLIIAAIVTISIFLIKFVLFEEKTDTKIYTVSTEILNKKFHSELNQNDILYDPITKRRIGTIDSLKGFECDEGTKFIITFTSPITPKSKYLRTKNLWFEFSYEGVSEY